MTLRAEIESAVEDCRRLHMKYDAKVASFEITEHDRGYCAGKAEAFKTVADTLSAACSRFPA